MSRLPMLFQDEVALRKGLDEVLEPAIEKELYRKDVKVLCMWWYPPHTIWTVDKKIETLADLQGLKLRVTSPQQGAFIQQFGAVPVTISTAEVAPAIQQGVVDGALTSASGAELWVDNFDYNYKLPLNFGTSFALANKQAFEGLAADQQTKLMDASKEGCEWVSGALADQEQELYDKYSGEGMVEIVMPDQAARDEAYEKAQTVWQDEAAKLGEPGETALGELRKMSGKL